MFFHLGKELQQQNLTVAIVISCSECFQKFINLMLRLPVVSLDRRPLASDKDKDSASHVKWRQPKNEVFSRIVNNLLVRNDWNEIAVLYDGKQTS